jgi:uncharacterized GH25 family protein
MFARPSLIAAGLALGLATLIPGQADAHRRWLLPSMTVFSGDKALVSVDGAASNELFVFEHRPLGLDDLSVIGPDGQKVEPKIIGSGDYRSVFDVPLAQQGTYRIALASEGTMGSYELNGERRRFRDGAQDVPAGATNVQLSQNSSRTETFVTLGAPSETALAATGKGIEMVPVTHPNDVVAGEPAVMRFLVDGQPASGLEIEFVAGGTRYRDDAGISNLTTDADGQVTLEVQTPGMYYLETASTVPAANGAPERRASYTAVLEFLPG